MHLNFDDDDDMGFRAHARNATTHAMQKYDPEEDADDSNTDAAATAHGDSKTTKKLKRTHSRLSFQFHVGEEGDE